MLTRSPRSSRSPCSARALKRFKTTQRTQSHAPDWLSSDFLEPAPRAETRRRAASRKTLRPSRTFRESIHRRPGGTGLCVLCVMIHRSPGAFRDSIRLRFHSFSCSDFAFVLRGSSSFIVSPVNVSRAARSDGLSLALFSGVGSLRYRSMAGDTRIMGQVYIADGRVSTPEFFKAVDSVPSLRNESNSPFT